MHRRRFRMRVEQALLGGMPLPRDLVQDAQRQADAELNLMLGPHASGRTRRRRRRQQLGPKPVLWEISLDDDKGRDDWIGLLPVATTVIHPVPDVPPTPTPQPPEESTLTRWEAFKLVMCGTARGPEEPVQRQPRPTRFTFRNSATNIISPRPPTPRPPRHPPLPPSTLPATSGIVTTQPTPLASLRPAPPPPPLKIDDDDAVMLGFVIAMPNPSRPLHRPSLPPVPPLPSSSTAVEEIAEQSKGKGRDDDVPRTFAWDDDELPEIVFGVIDVAWRNASRTSTRTPKKSFDSSSSE
ncbi:hypothetical protein FRB90_007503 [Tulasnella sp. 427]|nr:hypothetical protein FRB90_007503 [Tulasnella sp. 427]